MKQILEQTDKNTNAATTFNVGHPSRILRNFLVK